MLLKFLSGGNEIVKTIDEAQALVLQLSTQPKPATVPPALPEKPTSVDQPGPEIVPDAPGLSAT